MSNITNFIDLLMVSVDDKFKPIVEGMSGVVGGICGLAVFFYVGSKVWSSYARNESIDIYPLLKPFVIGLLCAQFYALVVTPINSLIEPISGYLAKEEQKQSLGNLDELKDKILDHPSWKSRDTTTGKEAGKDGAIVGKGEEPAGMGKISLRTFFQDIWTWITGIIFQLILLIFEAAISIVRLLLTFVLLGSRKFFLFVLAVIGPVSFAISLFPGYSQTLTSWISKYVSISFWLPIMSLCDIFINIVMSSVLENVAACTAVISSPFAPTFMKVLPIVLVVLVGFLSYFLYTSVPTMASWVISGGDTQGLQGTLSMTAAVGSIIGAVAGSAVAKSSISGAISKGISSASSGGGGASASAGGGASGGGGIGSAGA